MGKTCCLAPCKTNYRSEVKRRADGEETHVYRFPNERFYPDEHKRWVEVAKKIRSNLEVKHDTVICSRHWPPNAPMVKHYGKDRPAHPLSVFEGVAPSIIPEQPSDWCIFYYVNFLCVVAFCPWQWFISVVMNGY